MKTPKSKPTHAETKLRMPRALMAELREQYVQTYVQHQLSFNAWLLVRIADPSSLTKPRKGRP